MKALRFLTEISLYSVTKERYTNGALKETETLVDKYLVQPQEITDSISVSLYGAYIDKMYRISSVHNVLEKLLQSKVNNKTDNISNYCILFNGQKYKIKAVKSHWIDIQYDE